MLKPPPLKRFIWFPVTAGVAAASIAVTAMWWLDWSIDSLLMDAHVWTHWELWRAFTSVLPHVNWMHLAFNLYWFWVFGAFLEKNLGHLKFFLIVLILAFGSSLADFMLAAGGVGLSGVGYGLWA